MWAQPARAARQGVWVAAVSSTGEFVRRSECWQIQTGPVLIGNIATIPAPHINRELINVTRSDLISRIASQWPLLNAKDVEACVATILSAIVTKLAEGGRAEIRGFGSFSVHRRPPRTGRNPKTGLKVSVPAKYTPHFKPGTELRERVDRAVNGEKLGAGANATKREVMESVE